MDSSCFLVNGGSSSVGASGGFDDGCQLSGMGGYSGIILNPVTVVGSGGSQILQLAGVDGSLEAYATFSGPSQRPFCVGSITQSGECCLPDSSGGNQVQGLESGCKGDFPLGRNLVHFLKSSPHQGGGQCGSRLLEQVFSFFSGESAFQGSVSCLMQEIWHSLDRPLCIPAECSVGKVLLSDTSGVRMGVDALPLR